MSLGSTSRYIPEPTVPAGEAPPGSANDVAYFQLFSARNAKLISCLILLIVIVYHALLRLHYGEDTCLGLLEDGRYQGNHIWQPYGCMLHTYSLRNARMCMKYKRYWGQHNYFVFIGDQRTRQLFFSFLRHISAEEVTETPPRSYFARQAEFEDNAAIASQLNFAFVDKELNLTVEFVWDPDLKLLTDNATINRFSSPSHGVWPTVVIGSLVPTMKKSGIDETSRNYSRFSKSALSALLSHDRMQILWMLQGYVDESKIQSTSSKSPVKMEDFSVTDWNQAIDEYSYEIERLLGGSKVKVWRSASLLCSEKADSADGVQIGKIALDYNAQILLNFHCNDYMNFPDGTCCRRAEPRNIVQTCALVVYIASIFLTCVVALLRKRRCQTRSNDGASAFPFISPSDERKKMDPSQTSSVEGAQKSNEGEGRFSLTTSRTNQTITFGNGTIVTTLFTWSKISAIMLLVYTCDRTNYFMNENKWFTLLNFFLPTGYFVVLGLFFTDETGKSGFMNKDQTDEWKGWMQLILMVYNMTEASQVIWLYMLYRCLVSGYLFMLGYGHFVYFWTTGDLTIRKFVTVLLRYNFLALLLCLIMNRPYQFYQYTSLISYWFVIIYITMAIPPKITANSAEANTMHYLVMVVKFIVLYSVISVLYLSEVFFEKIFLLKPWRALFVMADGSIEEWWQRWWLDRYTVVNGMVLAFAVSILRRYLILSDGQPCNLFTRRLCVFSFLTGICGIGFYGFVAARCGNRLNCNEIHGYISFIPVLSYLVLRNLFGAVRTRVSTFFAWFGRISLELFTAQPHLWLAADAHGVLVLLPRWPVFNVIITSFIFVCFAHEANIVTKALVPLIAFQEGKVMVRNVLIIIAIFVSLSVLFGIV